MDSSESDIPESSMTEPVSEPEKTTSMPTDDYVKADTIEISREATQNVLNNVEKQRSKYWHFQFKNDKDKEDFTAVLTSIPGFKLTAEYNEKQNTPDITLRLGDQIVGKIHLLLSDRRDTGNTSKYYIKIHFYHFTDPALYSAVKAAAVNYFEGFKSTNNSSKKPTNNSSNKPLNVPMTAGKRKRRTHKKKRAAKKKTHRRK